jgi:hypothetical protein
MRHGIHRATEHTANSKGTACQWQRLPVGVGYWGILSGNGMARAVSQSIPLPYSNLAGTKTSIVIPAGCPFIECPASTFIAPCGVR